MSQLGLADRQCYGQIDIVDYGRAIRVVLGWSLTIGIGMSIAWNANAPLASWIAIGTSGVLVVGMLENWRRPTRGAALLWVGAIAANAVQFVVLFAAR